MLMNSAQKSKKNDSSFPKQLNSLIDYSEGGILSKVLHSAPNSNITLFCMAAGTELGEHTSTKEGTVHVLEGRGAFVLEGREIVMLPGVLIRLPKNAVHSLKAAENTAFLLTLWV